VPSFEHRLSQSDSGRRADKLVLSLIKGVTYAHVRKLFRRGQVTLNEQPLRADSRLGPRGLLVIDEGHYEEKGDLLPNRRIRLVELYKDEHFVCLNKAPGLVMLPGPGHGSDTVAAALIGAYPQIEENFGSENDYGMVHRLDKETSGVFIVPFTMEVRKKLIALFSDRQMDKTYQAIVRGHFDADSGEMTESLVPPKPGQRRGGVSEEGAESLTEWRVLEKLLSFTHLEIKPKTGRTHQIRIHCAHHKHPVSGDTLYAEPPYACKRSLLHAVSLAFKHPITGENIKVEAPLPRDFRRKIKRFRERDFTNMAVAVDNLEVKASPYSKVKASPEPEIEIAPELEVETVPKIEIAPEPKVETTAKIEAQVAPEPEAQVAPEPEAQVAPEPEAQVAPEPEAEVAPEPEAQVAPEPEAQVAPEPKPAKFNPWANLKPKRPRRRN
jgi:23S rRNA pseudouridine1911/1915/1917 synthase